MKKALKYVILFIIFIVVVIVYIINNKSPYPKGGKDVTESFGNGRFAIINGSWSEYPGGPKVLNWYLCDYKMNNILDDNLVSYYEKKPYAYIIGDNYTILNYKAEEYQIYELYEDIPKKEKEIFDNVKNKKIGRYLRDYVTNYKNRNGEDKYIY